MWERDGKTAGRGELAKLTGGSGGSVNKCGICARRQLRCRGGCGWDGINGGPELLQADLVGALFRVNCFLDFAAAFFLSGKGLILLLCGDGLFSFANFEFHLTTGVLELEL